VTKLDTFLAAGVAQVGKPYIFGADSPTRGFDCSGLVEYMAAQVGISLPHDAARQQQLTTRVSNPLPGDLVFYGQPATHVGIYLGAGKMLSAPHSGATVHVTTVGTPTNYGRISGLGTATAPAVSTVADGLSTVGTSVTDWLGGARYVVLEVVFAGLGLALVGFGLWRGVAAPARQHVTSSIEELL
jgi:hypothetical protein